jgi:hypothetical protein
MTYHEGAARHPPERGQAALSVRAAVVPDLSY